MSFVSTPAGRIERRSRKPSGHWFGNDGAERGRGSSDHRRFTRCGRRSLGADGCPSSRPTPRCIRPSALRRRRSTKCSSTHSAPAPAPTRPPRPPTQSRPAEADSHAGFRSFAAGDQLRAYVHRSRAGLDAGSRGSLAVAGRGADLRSVRVRLGCLNPHQRVMDRPPVRSRWPRPPPRTLRG